MSHDYKNSLNLPRTDFSMKADLILREPERLARWEQGRLYERIQARRSGAPRFVLHDGPPFANGDVHIGTALNKILKDIVVKYATLRGKRAPYIPGWDCHGLPIEFKVSQEMRKAGETTVEPSAIRKACEAYARTFVDLQRSQFKRLGVLGDWDHPYLTFDRDYEAGELRLFADIVEKGFVYRGKKPVYWSIPCRTALAEAEVEYHDHVSQSVYVKFPVQGQPGTSVLIWTTTPWTLPANLAIAFNSTFPYSLVRVGGEALILSTLLLDSVAKKCGWSNFEIVRSLTGDQLASTVCQHPFCDRPSPLYAGDAFVENTTGTGFVHIAPGHGLEDYGLGRQKGLPVYSPVDDEGRLALTSDLPADQQMPAELVGRSILEKNGRVEANEAVITLLSERQRLAHREDYTHSYPHCWRSKTPVIFRAMDQWFIRVDHEGFRERAVEEISRVRWIPDWGRNRIESAVKARPDWCISRQRSWGVPIPAFYDSAGQPILDPRIVRAAAGLFEEAGSHVWFEKSAAELWTLLRPANWTGPEAASKSQDTLDVWIDSGSSSRSVLQQRPELRADPGGDWRAEMYLEGSDQHRGWFQSSLLLSLAGHGQAPYRTVLTHGFMVDADREKISKSKQGQGGYEKPQTAEAYVKKYGADVVRLWVASQDFRNDIVVSDERIQKVGETYRHLRNTLRYQLSNLYDFDPARDTVPDANLDPLDRWILGEFSRLDARVVEAYDASAFHEVYQAIAQFAAVELSAIYHDLVKDRLYTDPAGSPRRRSTQTALHRLAAGLCQMLAPILAYTADEAWENLPGRAGTSVHESDWVHAALARAEEEQSQWASLLSLREAVLPELEKARQAKTIGKALEAEVVLRGGDARVAQAVRMEQSMRELLNVSQLRLEPSAAPGLEVGVAPAPGQKCERCWHRELEVGRDPRHPALCPRCVAAVEAGA
ncbi:MAG: isoleucine--tRNA ligase [Verrucomicrobia bacterium]|nr:isoleucine--tRNA ligase [Verrucomicrobiota bacterium]